MTEAKEEELEEEAEWIYNGAFLKPTISLQVSEEEGVCEDIVGFGLTLAG